MARIRSIKPDFFRHAELYDAERQSGLPLRLAFAGLWTAADREGRFAWSPRTLKLDCLPHDDVDFAAVLDVLAATGFIKRYEVEGKSYGFVPTWHDHQHINQREAQSKLPAPTGENTCKRVRARGEGKGREGKGKGKNIRAVADATRPIESPFDEFWKVYPKRKGANPKVPARKKFDFAVESGVDPGQIVAAAKQYAAQCRTDKIEPQFVAQAVTWLNQQRWGDYAPPDPENPAAANQVFVKHGTPEWDRRQAEAKAKTGKGTPCANGGWWFPVGDDLDIPPGLLRSPAAAA